MTRKQVVFGAGDKDLLKAAEGQKNFSVYIKNLIAADINTDEVIEEKVRCYEPNDAKPTLYIKKPRRTLPTIAR